MMPKLAKGYLRCGKILSLTKKTDLALQIYERGLLKVKISSPGPGRVVCFSTVSITALAQIVFPTPAYLNQEVGFPFDSPRPAQYQSPDPAHGEAPDSTHSALDLYQCL
ncbi:uncharacterized protein LY89DRAFT_736996 [Mollisia scopiformis]|uniref:Uncharacterized protein n=1 Tax=Mollisia scopiformis TaxID=149040 RepID=A0A194X1C5_MOLSC|nr:uncharacterized protein LY89DRAFT_736996 [Mollisia scopiformis]KUJ13993.1 hypothetical protein LY89DRAFT_736996 [Mollisia scopiformis]